MAPSKRTAAHAAPTSPFKRLKAKVGKKAPKAANYTDTAFRSASIHITKNQKSSLGVKDATDASGVLTSSRGRSVAELLGQMHHPAASIRLSAIKGIQDIVSGNKKHKQNTAMIAANLSVLLSAIGKASVDEEEDEVRQIGCSCLEKLLDQESRTDAVILSMMKPFLPLVLAYFKSALNSLDRDTRRDGLGYVHTLCVKIPLDMDVVASILPALIRIWDDKAFQATSNTDGANFLSKKKAKKRKQQKGSNTIAVSQAKSGRYPLLDCIFALMSGLPSQSNSETPHEKFANAFMQPTMAYVPGGRSKNALLFASMKSESQAVSCIAAVQNLPAFSERANDKFSIWGGKCKTGKSNEALPLDAASNLLGKLRDTIIELQENECLETLLRFVKVLDLFWSCFGDLLVDEAKSQEARTVQDFQAVCNQLTTLLLETFPFKPTIHVSNNAMVDSINGHFCLALVHMTHCTEELTKSPEKQRASGWLKPVVDYICNKLQDKSLQRPGNEVSHESILQVLLNLLRSNYDIVRNVPKLEKKLAKAFAQNLLPDDGDAISHRVARTNGGLVSFSIVATIFNHVGNDLERAHDLHGELALRLAAGLPEFLLAWQNGLPESSAMCIQLLSFLFRNRRDSGEDEDFAAKISSVVLKLRHKLEGMVNPEGATTDNGRKVSLLELYPAHLQRLLIGLFITLESPTHNTLLYLSDLNARSNLGLSRGHALSSEVSSFLIHSMYSIRKTIPMQQFLSFLVDSTGATRAAARDEDSITREISESDLIRYDQGLKASCKALIHCGAEKIAPMLSPLILLFLKEDPTVDYVYRLFRTRFAFSTLAMLALEVKSERQLTSLLPMHSFEIICKSVVDTFKRTKTSGEFHSIATLEMAPVMALLFAEPELLSSVFIEILKSLPLEEDSSQQNSIRWLHTLAQDRRMGMISRENKAKMVNLARDAEARVSGQVLGQLVVALEVA